MKIILKKNVYNLGDAGDICEVKDGYARNYLLPKKIAIKASLGSTKAILHQKKISEIQKTKRKKEIQDIYNLLNEKEVTISAKMTKNQKLFGSITTSMIAKKVKQTFNIDIDKRKIEVKETIKSLGSFYFVIKLLDNLNPKLKLNVIEENNEN